MCKTKCEAISRSQPPDYVEVAKELIAKGELPSDFFSRDFVAKPKNEVTQSK